MFPLMRWIPRLLITSSFLALGANARNPAPASPAPPEAKPAVVVTGKLGGKGNPVRCDGPQGQRDYLSRLRDYSDNPVTFKRAGTLRAGPYGNALDAYQVSYPDGYAQELYLDMYHPGFVEKGAPAGFKIVPPAPPPQPVVPPPKIDP